MLDVLLALATATAPAAAAFPIPPVPLFELCAHADTIVVAHVGKPYSIETDDDALFLSHEVELTTLNQLEGAFTPSLRVRYEGGLICPAPPRFEEGARVLTFLRSVDDGTYRVVGLSYGTKELERRAEKVTCERITELVELQRRTPTAWYTSRAYLNWIVRCAEDPATITAASAALSPRTLRRALANIADWSPDLRLVPAPDSLANRLNDSQRGRILDAIRSPAGESFRWARLLTPFTDTSDPRFEKLALEELGDEDLESLGTTIEVIKWLGKRWDDPRVNQFVERIKEIGFDEILTRRTVLDFLEYAEAR